MCLSCYGWLVDWKGLDKVLLLILLFCNEIVEGLIVWCDGKIVGRGNKVKVYLIDDDI